MSWSRSRQIVLMGSLLVIGMLVSATMAQAQTRSLGLNDPQQPGSVIVFPKFITGTVLPPGDIATPKTEISLGVVCPPGGSSGGLNCSEVDKVKIKLHWVCGAREFVDSQICHETDWILQTTLNGKLVFNTQGTLAPGNVVAPNPPCEVGYLIAWVVDAQDRPIKFDGLIGEAVLRFSNTSVTAYKGITIQADPALASGALITTAAATATDQIGGLIFDGGLTNIPPTPTGVIHGHYQAIPGVVYGDVAYDKITVPTRSTALTFLTLDVHSGRPNYPTFVDINFYNSAEVAFSTHVEFICHDEIRLADIGGANLRLESPFVGSRKGVFKTAPANKIQNVGNFDTAGPVTLMGLVDTLEGPVTGDERAFIFDTYNNGIPVPTTFYHNSPVGP